MIPSKVLIVGCGYLGSRIGSILVSMGARVTATTRTPERFAELARLGLEPVLLDLARPGESDAWSTPHDAMVLAAAPGRGGDPRAVFLEGPLACARKLAEREEGASPRAAILISSTGVYAQCGGELVDETSPAQPVEERHRLLRAAEEGILSLSREGALRGVVLRLGGLHGPGRSPVEWLRRPEMCRRILEGSGDAFMSWVHAGDAARAAALALERGRAGEIYNITDDEPVRRADFYRLAAELAGIPAPHFPAGSGDLGKRCSNAKARAELGFRPEYATYREGLRAGDP